MANIGPGALDAVKNSPFLLSQAEWLRVQRYVTNAMSLPNTEPRLRMALSMPDSMKIDEFKQLLDGYQTVVPHVTKWKTKTYPDTVSLAADIVNYNTQVPAFYGGVITNVDKLLADPTDQAAKTQLAAIIKKLSGEAEARATKAQALHAEIQTFAQVTASDTLLFDGLVKTYDKKFGDNSERAKKLAKDLKETNELIQQATEEYEYDKAVACATPSYAWIVVPPIGLIAAVIVAGIYGDKAVKAKQRLEGLQKDLAAALADQNLAFLLIGMISICRDSLAGIQRDIHAALPVIQKIQGVWHALHADLAFLGEIITKDIDQAILEIKALGVSTAIEQWRELALKADAYRAHAYIEVATEQAA
jgi:hypothetical protein